MPKPRRGYQVRLTGTQKAEVLALYEGGVHYTQIIERFGCSYGTLWSIVKGVRLRVLKERFEQEVQRLSSIAPIKIGWVAGILDGDGCIGINDNRDKRAVKAGKVSRSLTPRVEVWSTTEIMQLELREILGVGHLGYRRPTAVNCRPTYGWTIWSVPPVGALLSVVLPQLVVKRKVAEIVRNFCITRLEHDMQPYTEKDFAVVSEVRKLNAKGRKALDFESHSVYSSGEGTNEDRIDHQDNLPT